MNGVQDVAFNSARFAAQLPMDPLAELRDIHLPPPPSWWPPAPGWWLAGLLALTLIAAAVRYLLARHRRGRGRRTTMRALARLRSRYDAGEAPQVVTAELATLLRRAALARYPREQVAGLSGRRWLEFLDGDDHPFTRGVGTCLTTAPYAAGEAVDVEALLSLCEVWVRRNL